MTDFSEMAREIIEGNRYSSPDARAEVTMEAGAAD